MKPIPHPTDSGNQAQEAFTKLLTVVSDGLRYGYFDCSVSCEVVDGQKRIMTIHAGKKYRFTIPKEDLFAVQIGRLLGLERQND